MIQCGAPGPKVEFVAGSEGIPAVLEGLGLRPPRPVLVVVGGASGMTTGHNDALRRLLSEHVLAVLEDVAASVVDGGTRSGVMQVVGEALAGEAPNVPLVGVAAAGTVRVPGRESTRADAADLDPNHTAVLLVPGSEWGDESPWIDAVARALAGGAPSAVLLVNGGEIAFTDVGYAVQARRPVVTLAGSGRCADSLAAAARGARADPRAIDLAASGLVHAVAIDDGPGVGGLLRRLLT